MIDVALPYDGDGLETAMWMLRKSRHHLSVVHAEAILHHEIIAKIATGKGRRRQPHLLVTLGVVIEVVHAEQEGIDRGPRKAQRRGFDDSGGHDNQQYSAGFVLR
jgi:hypothetical protein